MTLSFLHYTTPHYTQLQLQLELELQLHYTKYTALHYSYNYTTLH